MDVHGLEFWVCLKFKVSSLFRVVYGCLMCLQLVCFSCVQARRKVVKELFFGFCLKMCLCFASVIFSFFNVCFWFVTVVSGTPP